MIEDGPYMTVQDIGIVNRDMIHVSRKDVPSSQTHGSFSYAGVNESTLAGHYRNTSSNSDSSSSSKNMSDVSISKSASQPSYSDDSFWQSNETRPELHSPEAPLPLSIPSSEAYSSDSRSIVLDLLNEFTQGRPVGPSQAHSGSTGDSASSFGVRSSKTISWKVKRRNRFLPSIVVAGSKKRPGNAVENLFNSDMMDSIEWQMSEA